MSELRTAHTSELDSATVGAARELLDAVFGDDMTDDDWEHALGGVHALVWEGDELIGHASVVQRRLLHGGRARETPRSISRASLRAIGVTATSGDAVART